MPSKFESVEDAIAEGMQYRSGEMCVLERNGEYTVGVQAGSGTQWERMAAEGYFPEGTKIVGCLDIAQLWDTDDVSNYEDPDTGRFDRSLFVEETAKAIAEEWNYQEEWSQSKIRSLEEWFMNLPNLEIKRSCKLTDEELQWGENVSACFDNLVSELERGTDIHELNRLPVSELISRSEVVLDTWND